MLPEFNVESNWGYFDRFGDKQVKRFSFVRLTSPDLKRVSEWRIDVLTQDAGGVSDVRAFVSDVGENFGLHHPVFLRDLYAAGWHIELLREHSFDPDKRTGITYAVSYTADDCSIPEVE